mgnify:CR=1 FL=1
MSNFKISAKYIIVFVIALVGIQNLQGQCYEVLNSTSGVESLYEDLDPIACDIKTALGFSAFEVLGCDLYPLKYYLDPDDSFKSYFETVVESLGDKDGYILISKEFHEAGEIVYRTHIKFPEVGSFLDMNVIEKESVIKLVELAIEENQGFGSMAEQMGLQKFLEIIENGLPENVLEMAGFVKLSVENSAYSRSGKSSFSNNVLDLCGGKSEANNVLLADLFSGTGKYMNCSISSVISDDLNLPYKIHQAKNYMLKESTTDFSLWFHVGLDEDQNIEAVYYKGTTNLTLEQIEEKVFDDMSLHDVSLNNKEDISYKGDGCGLSWEFGKNCLLPMAGNIGNDISEYHAGVGIGLLDKILSIYQLAWKGFISGFESIKGILKFDSNDIANLKMTIIKKIAYSVDYVEELYNKFEAFKLKAKIFIYETFVSIDKFLEEDFNEVASYLYSLYEDPSKALSLIAQVIKLFYETMGQKIENYFEKDAALIGYDAGKIAFEIMVDIVIGVITGSAGFARIVHKLAKFAKPLLKGATEFVSTLMKNKSKITDPKDAKSMGCAMGLFGCFVKDTPVLIAGNRSNFGNSQNKGPQATFERDVRGPKMFNLKNGAKSLAVAAAMPIVAVPIQEIQLLDYAVAHETVNSTYGLTASTDDDIYLGLLDKDPYTSDQQRERDEYEINDTDWNEVVFEEVNGLSTAKFALHNDWIILKGYLVDGVVNLDLPEQGISGPFKITSIRHILPQKKPTDEDDNDDYGYKPVTALFTHVSNQVYTIDFDNGESLGVTYQHPIYSVTNGDWRLAGELEVGEQILTKDGEATVISSVKKEGSETVYNLEVKELHNFLVGELGVVVHNACNKALIKKYLDDAGDLADLPDGAQKSTLQKLKQMKDSGDPDYQKFLGDFPDDVPLGVGDGGLDAWKLVKDLPGGKIWVRKNPHILKKMAGLTPDQRVKMKEFYRTFNPNGPYPTTRNGIEFNEFGFVKFSDDAVAPISSKKYYSEGLDGLSENSQDYGKAAEWFVDNNPNATLATGGQGIVVDGKYYTMHHMEDGKTMMPILQSVHTAQGASHTGGASIIRNGLKGVFAID